MLTTFQRNVLRSPDPFAPFQSIRSYLPTWSVSRGLAIDGRGVGSSSRGVGPSTVSDIDNGDVLQRSGDETANVSNTDHAGMYFRGDGVSIVKIDAYLSSSSDASETTHIWIRDESDSSIVWETSNYSDGFPITIDGLSLTADQEYALLADNDGGNFHIGYETGMDYDVVSGDARWTDGNYKESRSSDRGCIWDQMDIYYE